MAKKQVEATPEAKPSEALATAAASTDLKKVDSWMVQDDGTPTGDLAGTEDIALNEVRLPRLAIAQGLSPQIASDTPIENLKLYEMFNDLTNTIYGRGPLHFIPCLRQVRYIEFKPREEGGGVLDIDVPANDPRTEWTKDKEGERVPPRATKFTDFVVLLLREGVNPEPIVLSIKDTNKHNRAAAVKLNSFIKLRNDAIYGGIYTVSSKPEKNDSGTFGVFVVDNAGKAAPAIREKAKAFFDSLKGKKIVASVDDIDDDTHAEGAETAEGQPEGVPF